MWLRWALALMLAVAIIAYVTQRLGPTRIPEGAAAPSFVLPDLQGQLHSLEKYRDSVVIVNFWSITCGPCIAELPALNRLRERFAGRSFEILGINTDGGPAALGGFLQQHPIHFPILFDRRGDVANQYEVWAIPTSLLLDRNGHLVRRITGAIQWDHPDVLAEIERLLP